MDAHSTLFEHADPQLRSPILIAAFRGWNDAGESATTAVAHLQHVWAAELMSSIDPEEFFDFQSVRPQVELVDGVTRRITWPANEFHFAKLEGEHDVILLLGTEPSNRWRTFSEVVVEQARKHDVRFVVTLGALLADVPHSRPVHITGTAADQKLVERLGLQRSGYEGPTGIVGVLHDSFGRAGIESASLWATVPHYLAVSPNPKAAKALVEKAADLIGIPASTIELEHAAATYEQRVSDLVATDEDVQAYVQLLEERVDDDSGDQIDPSDLPSGDALAAELEKFLRERDT